ncbi:MAG: hypothetical protein RLZZ292_848 [Bacteroidota bacterium]|jgi:outer membrane protein assembly factor BamB
MKRNLVITILLGVLYLLSGCSPECPDGICTPKLLWTQPLDGGKMNTTFAPIIYKDKVIYSRDVRTGEYTSKSRLRFLDKNTGNLRSEWNDLLSDIDRLSYNGIKYVNNNLLIFSNNASVSVVDMDKESTQFKTNNAQWCGVKDMVGLNEIVYHTESECDSVIEKEFIVEYNIATQKQRVVYSTTPKDENVRSMKTPKSYINKVGDTVLVFNVNYYKSSPSASNDGRLIAYNVTQKKEEYNEQLAVDSYAGFPALPLLYNGKVYMPFGKSIFCHDQFTGKQLWRKFFTHVFLSSDPIIVEGKLYAACENERLYCLNLDTGDIIWETDGAGTPSDIVYMNGVIYFVGGGDGKLHAVDAVTGSHIWRFASPDLIKNENAYFQQSIVADPSTNRIYTATYLNAMCFKAAR